MTGYNQGLPAVDGADRLLIPSSRDGTLQIVSPEGVVVRRIDLRGVLAPSTAVDGGGGRIWVGGGAVGEPESQDRTFVLPQR